MGFLLVLAHPLLLALVALIVVFFGVAWISGAFATEREEARAGIVLLCAMRWNEFSRLITEVLKDRGLQPSSSERSPGKDGFDLLFTRGNSRYLVQCANAAGPRISASAVGQLYTLTQMQDADGAIIASCAPAEPAAMKLAQERRIEVIAAHELWAHVKPWVAYDQRIDAETAARAVQRRRLVIATLVAVLAAIVAYPIGAMLDATLGTQPAPAVAVPQSQPAGPRPSPVVAKPGTAPMPDATLSAEQLASRRAAALLEVRSLNRVQIATWTSQSTLQVTMSNGLADADLNTMVDDICSSLLQYEELRFTRLQLEVPTGNIARPTQVRWRQCR